MRIDQLLKVQSAVENRAIPSDMYEKEITYYSESKGHEVNVLTLDLCHFIRAFNKVQAENEELKQMLLKDDSEIQIIIEKAEEKQNFLEKIRKLV